MKNYHRYGLQFNNNHSQLFLLILLAGDVALNPGPTINSNHTSDLKLNQLNALYLNARSLKAFVPADNDSSSKVCKITLLQHLVYSGSYDLICICKTWLNETVLSSELLPGYSIFRCDRVGKIGGGVLVAIKSNIRAIRRMDLEREDMELVVVEFTTQCNKTTILYTFYRPPNSYSDVIQHLNTSLQSNPESSNIILIGDFNLPAFDWSLNQQTPATIGGQLEESFCDLIEDNFLQQYISGSTHKDGNKLDLLLCNCPEIIKNVSSLPPDQLCTGTKTALYADDTKLHRNIFSARDCDSLPESLVKLDSWSMENKLFFNASKCKVLTITRKKNPVIYEYTLGSKKLTRVDHVKDLGIMTTTNITWDLHVNTVVAKANKMLGILKRTCTSITDITIDIRRTLYLSFVKSQLLYASEVWSPVNNVKLAKASGKGNQVGY